MSDTLISTSGMALTLKASKIDNKLHMLMDYMLFYHNKFEEHEYWLKPMLSHVSDYSWLSVTAEYYSMDEADTSNTLFKQRLWVLERPQMLNLSHNNIISTFIKVGYSLHIFYIYLYT